MTITYSDTLGKHNIDIPADLIADAEVPVLTGPQAQGDVGIFPRCKVGAAELAAMIAVPAEGVAVVRGEATTGANSHILDAYHGPVFWQPSQPSADGSATALGVLHVPEGSVAMLTHTDEHTSNGIGAGTYVLAGKREAADVLRRVCD